MDNSNRNSNSEVSLQDLLKVKRLERPDEAFWQNFDQELSDRTLKQLVKPSFFSQVSNLASIVLKPRIPMGALAVLTLGVFLYNIFPKYSQSNAHIVKVPTYENENLMDFTAAKKNFVKANIVMDLPDSSMEASILDYPSASGIRYLSGSFNTLGVSSGMASSTIY